jgi:hypothetical protein
MDLGNMSALWRNTGPAMLVAVLKGYSVWDGIALQPPRRRVSRCVMVPKRRALRATSFCRAQCFDRWAGARALTSDGAQSRAILTS